MADVKWIKIITDIFDDEKMFAIETQQDGYLIELIWFKLLCLAGKCNNHGFLMISEKIAYTDEMLSKIFRVDIGNVQRALMLFQQLDMVELVDNAYMISNWDKHQNVKALEDMRKAHAESQKKYRDKQRKKALEKKSDITGDVTGDSRSDITDSYSISNNNIINIIIVLNKHKYKDYINNNNRLLDSIKEWMEYKDQKEPKKSNHYDTEVGMSKLLTEIVNKDKQYGTDNVIQMINRSISREWTGIIWDGIEKFPKPAFNPSSPIEEPKEEEPEMTDEEWVKMVQESDFYD